MTDEIVKLIMVCMTTEDLCAAFDQTSNRHEEPGATATVRGWMMEELEARDPMAFKLWIEENADSPTPYYVEGA